MDENKNALRAIFNEALDIEDAAERAAFLERACSADANLRRRVGDLLQAHAHAGGFFGGEDRAVDPITEKPGDRVGRYKLLQKIGEGGCGIVYMAEQEEPVRRKVALKVIKLGMDTRSVIARFEAERQALAMMDHPNIAKIFDAGSTERPLTRPSDTLSPVGGEGRGEGEAGYSHPSDGRGVRGEGLSAGRPFFVMELVRGIPITTYCDENNLSTRERLDLFVQVCQAVQHAHQKGIIHRDLKPSNILVTVNDGVPVPKVIDFGIAKATGQQRLTDKTVFTAFEQFIGTPAYMSPEQAAMTSLDINTRSDIYSLGVLLYELLTGQTPFDAKELLAAGLDEMRRIIRETEPLKPSTRLTRTRAASHGIGSAKSEIRNPKSEIDRDLDWIVMKCLEKDRNRRYETANGLATDIRRHLSNDPVVARPPSTSYRFQKLVRRNKLQFAAATIVASVLIVASVVSSWQAVIARRERRAAQEQSEIARSVKDFLTEQLLAAHPYVAPESNPNRRAILEQVAGALEGKFTNQPSVEAEIRYTLESGFSGLADVTNALVQGQRLLELRRRTLGPTHSDTVESMAYVALHYLHLGRRKEAEMLVDEGMRANNASSPELSFGTAWLAFARGRLLLADGRSAEALPYMRKALPALIRTLKPTDHRLVIAMWDAAYITQEAGQTEEAERLWAEGIRHFERELGADHPATAQFQKGYAYSLLLRGHWTNAMELLERAVATYHRSLPTNHNNVLDAEDLLALAYEQKGDTNAAAKIYASTYPRWVKHFPYGPALDHCNKIANFFVRQRRYEEARAVFRSLRDSFETNPPNRSQDFDRLIAATAAVDGWPAAAEMCRKYFDRVADSTSGWLRKAWIFRFVGDEERYQQVAGKVLALTPTAKSLDDQRKIVEIAALGPCELSANQLQQLGSLIQTLQRDLPRATTNRHAWGYQAIGALQLRLGRFQECLAALEDASRYADREERASTLLVRAMCLQRLGRADEARATFDESESIMKPLLPELLGERESFLAVNQLPYLVLRRDAQTLLAGSQPKP